MNIFQPKIGVFNDVSHADFSLAVGPHNDNIYIQTDICYHFMGSGDLITEISFETQHTLLFTISL